MLELLLLWSWNAATCLYEGMITNLNTLQTSNFGNYYFFFRATPMAYRGSQARGLIGAVAAGLRQRHSNARSELHLRPTPQLMATLDH